jgi:hypothetical protein
VEEFEVGRLGIRGRRYPEFLGEQRSAASIGAETLGSVASAKVDTHQFDPAGLAERLEGDGLLGEPQCAPGVAAVPHQLDLHLECANEDGAQLAALLALAAGKRRARHH